MYPCTLPYSLNSLKVVPLQQTTTAVRYYSSAKRNLTAQTIPGLGRDFFNHIHAAMVQVYSWLGAGKVIITFSFINIIIGLQLCLFLLDPSFLARSPYISASYELFSPCMFKGNHTHTSFPVSKPLQVEHGARQSVSRLLWRAIAS